MQRDFVRSGSQLGSLITNYDELGTPRQRGRGHLKPDATPSQIDARRRFEHAVRALNSAADVVLHVVIEDLSASSWAIDRGLPRYDGAALIRFGLSELARHYNRTRSRYDEPPPQAEAA